MAFLASPEMNFNFHYLFIKDIEIPNTNKFSQTLILNKSIIIQKEDTPCSPEVSSFIVEMIVPSRKRILI